RPNSVSHRLYSSYLPPRPLPSFPTRRSSDLSPPSTAACPACSPSPTTCGGRAPRTRTSTKRASRRRPPASTPWTCTPATPSCARSEEHTSELQSRFDLVCRLLLEKKKQSQHT